jgi:hypothetical protein
MSSFLAKAARLTIAASFLEARVVMKAKRLWLRVSNGKG